MTDRELLELAAKAAGIFVTKETWPYSTPITDDDLALRYESDGPSVTGTRVWYGYNGEIGGTEDYTWRPLTDDGDALRLAVKLRMTVDAWGAGAAATIAINNRAFVAEPHYGDDPERATRRAIVRAAAEIGKGIV